MSDSAHSSGLSECSSSADHQMKLIMEENVGLKSYIDNMNKECLELNAALFEEANKMVNAARSKQFMAEKKLKEKNQENELLRSQVQSLREVIAKLPSPVESTTPSSWLSPSRSKDGSRRFNSGTRRRHAQRNSMQSTPTLFRKSCENLSLLMSSDSGPSLTAISRSVLFEALLAEEHDADETDRLTFQAFCDWIRDGCPLTLTEDIADEQCLVSSKSDISDDFKYMVRTNASQSASDIESDHEQVSSTQYPESLTREHQSTPFDCFMHYLLEFDVRPCLLFRNARIRRAIYHALPEQTLEMTPITRFTGVSQFKISKEYSKYCPLLPPLEPSYQLTIEKNAGTKEDQNIVVNVSSEARNRIASVISLFQYLKLVARQCQSIIAQKTDHSEKCISDPLVHLDHTMIEKQFAKIQRLRLGIAFARLGFGIPEME